MALNTKKSKTDVEKLYIDFNAENFTLLTSYKEVIEQRLEKIIKLTEEIGELIEDEGEFNQDLEKYAAVEVSFRNDLKILSNFLADKQAVRKRSPNEFRASGNNLKLPKFELKTFDGDAANFFSVNELGPT